MGKISVLMYVVLCVINLTILVIFVFCSSVFVQGSPQRQFPINHADMAKY